MPEIAEPQDIGRFTQQAANLVDKAIRGKGQVTSIYTGHGMAKSFNDQIAETVWNDYVRDAMTEVDDGNWQDAHQIARDMAIGRTARTLMNQS
jgi:hypothetical protein